MDATPQSLIVRLCAEREADASVDQHAWSRFVALYTPLLYHWANRLEPQEADALDLVQDVFLLLHQKIPDFHYDRTQSFRSWLRTVLYNKWCDRGRMRQPPSTPGSDQISTVSVEDPLELMTEEDYRRYLVRRAMELMQTDFEPSTWKAFWETSVQSRPAAEVAAELGLSLAAVYKAASRVRQRLRQELEGLLD